MRKTIIAEEGYILTDGNIYGRTIHLAEGVDETSFYQITEEEYEQRILESHPDPEFID